MPENTEVDDAAAARRALDMRFKLLMPNASREVQNALSGNGLAAAQYELVKSDPIEYYVSRAHLALACGSQDVDQVFNDETLAGWNSLVFEIVLAIIHGHIHMFSHQAISTLTDLTEIVAWAQTLRCFEVVRSFVARAAWKVVFALNVREAETPILDVPERAYVPDVTEHINSERTRIIEGLLTAIWDATAVENTIDLDLDFNSLKKKLYRLWPMPKFTTKCGVIERLEPLVDHRERLVDACEIGEHPFEPIN
ncbi:hypothetical protein KEM56_007630 [Ascosphaera pollenicola]|nr:hypothetical protein KEM56_007630 [Ascosphaera pollenicola]